MTLTLVTTLVALLTIADLVGFVARRIGLPYPVLLVVVGLQTDGDAIALGQCIPHARAAPTRRRVSGQEEQEACETAPARSRHESRP